MDAFMGMIAQFGFNFVPKGWLACNGQLLPISQYSALFSLLGTFYGGDGVNTFALPNLQGRSAVGIGQGAGLAPINIGQVGGSNQVSLTTANLPSHVHTLKSASLAVYNGAGDTNVPVNGFLSNIPNGYSENHNASSNSIAGQTDPIGSNVPVNVENPYLGLNFCICVEGIYPART